jgi:hypothetical protein
MRAGKRDAAAGVMRADGDSAARGSAEEENAVAVATEREDAADVVAAAITRATARRTGAVLEVERDSIVAQSAPRQQNGGVCEQGHKGEQQLRSESPATNQSS